MIEAGLSQGHYLPYVVFINRILTLQGVNVESEEICSCNCTNKINRNTLSSIGLVKTEKGWRIKDEVDLVHSSASTPAQNEERTNYFLEINFERFVAEQFKHLNEIVTGIEGKIDNLQQQRVNNSSEGSEESSDEDSMDMSNSD
ncbi:hypothetical protein LR48_Vigan01g090900 [Vigna angularis]|uniref:Uncharacterized protein n=1 Tax=Phaseolus angularis TaxID=3914 RepID=A0A0L9TMG8_PHAAN|nr:hypothetical protein LR48_Vigan01g090900 [Vigna angularis]